MSSRELFDAVLAKSRLGMVGPFALSRILLRVKVRQPEELTRESLAQALPHIEELLRLYLRPEQVQPALRDIRAMLPGAAQAS